MKRIQAYPNYDQYLNSSPSYDLKKWMQAAREMYYQVHNGKSKDEVLNKIIAEWTNMEKLDFKNWLKYYEGDSHNKYKTAQVNYWENANRAGYFVPIYPNPSQPDVNTVNIDNIKNPETHPDVHADEKREIIEKQRQKIIGRLDSAEKLLRSQEGQIFAGKELETLLDVIYSLKKKIQMVNKISLSTKLYEDMIIREANVLTKRGFSKAGAMLETVAQTTPAPPPNPTSGGGLPGNIPGEAPGQVPPLNENPNLEVEKPVSEGMNEFLEGLETNNDTFLEDGEREIEVTDADDDLDLLTTAQVETQPNLEVRDEEPRVKDFDNLIDAAFSSLTINDIVIRLEDLTKIFKIREIPRQLAIIDMMLDRLGLASFFPSLAEATNKSLESNQYISTRIEDILSRLRGTLETKEIDLKNENAQPTSPQVQNVKRHLQDEQDKERARKQMRKDLENESLISEEKATPEVEIAEDLAQPTQVQRAPAAGPPIK